MDNSVKKYDLICSLGRSYAPAMQLRQRKLQLYS